MIKAQIVADSLSPQGCRLTTMLVTFPRYILAELNTHRMLSKNSASSRAIPFSKMLESVKSNPFVPIAWQKDHKGMQGTEYLGNTEDDNYDVNACITEWLAARDFAVQQAMFLSEIGTTKQLINRLLEPFMWHTVLISGTEWENFFALRCPRYVHKGSDTNYRSRKDYLNREFEDYEYPFDEGEATEVDWLKLNEGEATEVDWLKLNEGQADIHMMALAEAIWDAMNESTPIELSAGDWHIPFQEKIPFVGHLTKNIDSNNTYWSSYEIQNRVKVSTAMCARTSYTVVGEEGKPINIENDLKLHDRLSTSHHWSPFEHCAQVMTDEEFYSHISGKGVESYDYNMSDYYKVSEKESGWCGNFRGFIQYRKMFTNENITK